MINARWFSCDKDERSTKQPGGGVPLAGELKEDCGVISPHFLVDGDVLGFNYCEIPELGRNYWVKNWVWRNGLWEAQLVVDVLGSYRAEIGNSVEYVVRAVNGDGAVVDSLYQPTADVTTVVESAGRPFLRPTLGGTFCLGVIGKSSSTGPCYYLVDPVQMTGFTNYLFSDNDYLGIDTDEISAGLQKALYNPAQYVVSCVWYPFTVANAGSAENIKFGWWVCQGASGRLLPAGMIYSGGVDFAVPKHPDSVERGKYLNLSPWSRYELYLRPFGTFQLDSSLLVNTDSLSAEWHIDLSCGNAVLEVLDDNSDMLLEVNGMVGVPIQLAQMARNPFAGMQMSRANANAGMSVMGGVINGAASLIAGDIGGGVSALTGIGSTAINWKYDHVESAAKAQIPMLTTSGSQGSRADLYEEAQLVGRFAGLPGEDRAHQGRPLMQMRRIGSLSGFVQVAAPKIQIARATADEMGLIKEYMTGGFYFE